MPIQPAVVGLRVPESRVWEVRYFWDNPRYDDNCSDKCMIMWHPDLKNGPHCAQPLGHGGDHAGNAFSWSQTPHVDATVAKKFLTYYRSIPNSNHDITLRDDGTVSMSLGAFQAATAFIGVNMHGDG